MKNKKNRSILITYYFILNYPFLLFFNVPSPRTNTLFFKREVSQPEI